MNLVLARLRRWTLLEHVAHEEDQIGNVDRVVTDNIGCLHGLRTRSLLESIANEVDDIADIQSTVAVDVTRDMTSHEN